MQILKDVRIVVDMDETLCDLSSKWLGQYNADYNDNITTGDLLTYDTHLYVDPACGTKIYGYLEQPNFFRNLKPVPGAIETITWMQEHFVVIIATSRSAFAHEDTIAWISEYLPMFPLENVVFAKRKDLIDADILIDDCLAHIEAWRGVPIVFGDYAYNTYGLGQTAAKNWGEVRAYLQQLILP